MFLPAFFEPFLLLNPTATGIRAFRPDPADLGMNIAPGLHQGVNLPIMKAAFAYLDKRIAPVFDTAHRIHVVEVESGRIVSETQELLVHDLPMQKTLRLAELGVGTLICGAISRPLQVMAAVYGIQVMPFVAGDLKEVIQAWLKGGLHGSAFAMPGCCRRGRRLEKIHGMNTGEIKMNGRGKDGMGAGRGQGRGGGRGQSGSQGRGRMGGPLAAGTVGTCLCPKCGQRLAHERGVPCVQRQCPKCGTAMIRE
jgi:predicted Fe-Mo cluster-binding NifX family protein